MFIFVSVHTTTVSSLSFCRFDTPSSQYITPSLRSAQQASDRFRETSTTPSERSVAMPFSRVRRILAWHANTYLLLRSNQPCSLFRSQHFVSFNLKTVLFLFSSLFSLSIYTEHCISTTLTAITIYSNKCAYPHTHTLTPSTTEHSHTMTRHPYPWLANPYFKILWKKNQFPWKFIGRKSVWRCNGIIRQTVGTWRYRWCISWLSGSYDQ